eukprot:PITA_32630
MLQVVIDLKHLRHGKGKSVQEFTQEFRRKELALGISLDTRETLFKCIGSLHSYLQHTLLMFNPDDFDEVCVQAIHIESGGRPFKISSQSSKYFEIKYSNDKLNPKKFLKEEDEKKEIVAVQQDLSSDSGDERRITAMVTTGKTSDITSSLNTIASSSNINPSNEDKRVELFNIRITSKHIKIDTMFDSGSQANLISEYLVKNMGLETWNHPRPYPLGWLNKSTQIKVTKQC